MDYRDPATLPTGTVILKQNPYVYVYKNPIDNKIFYVGKGTNPSRMLAHCAVVRTGAGYAKNKYLTRKIKTILEKGAEPVIIRLLEFENEKDALECERLLIGLYRRRGHILCNMTDGGEGTSGRVATPDQRRKMSEAQRSYPHKLTQEGMQRIIAAHKGRKHRPETIEKMRLARRGKKRPPEAMAAMHAYWRGRPRTEEEKHRISSSLRKAWATSPAQWIESENYAKRTIRNRDINTGRIKKQGGEL